MDSSRYSVAFLALTLIIGASSSRSIAQGNPGTQEDQSLLPAEYVDLGFPAVDRPWSASDYQIFFGALRRLPAAQYPRTSSLRSGAVVDRLVDPDNLSLCRNKSLPLEQRFPPCLDQVDAANGVYKLYLSAHNRMPIFADDLIRLQGFMLYAVDAELGLLDEFLPTLDKTDPTYPTRLAGVEQMKDGITQMIQGNLITLEDRKTFSNEARAELASTIAATFPSITSHLPPLSVTEFDATLRRIANEETNGSVKAAIWETLNR